MRKPKGGTIAGLFGQMEFIHVNVPSVVCFCEDEDNELLDVSCGWTIYSVHIKQHVGANFFNVLTITDGFFFATLILALRTLRMGSGGPSGSEPPHI